MCVCRCVHPPGVVENREADHGVAPYGSSYSSAFLAELHAFFEGQAAQLEAARERLGLPPDAPAPDAGGADLEAVAAVAGLTRQQLVALVAAIRSRYAAKRMDPGACVRVHPSWPRMVPGGAGEGIHAFARAHAATPGGTRCTATCNI
jgi:hypothetical protein